MKRTITTFALVAYSIDGTSVAGTRRPSGAQVQQACRQMFGSGSGVGHAEVSPDVRAFIEDAGYSAGSALMKADPGCLFLSIYGKESLTFRILRDAIQPPKTLGEIRIHVADETLEDAAQVAYRDFFRPMVHFFLEGRDAETRERYHRHLASYFRTSPMAGALILKFGDREGAGSKCSRLLSVFKASSSDPLALSSSPIECSRPLNELYNALAAAVRADDS